MFLILLISYLLITINGISVNIIEKDLNNSIEKILLINNNLFIGTINSLHRLSSLTLNQNLFPLKLGPQLDNPYCRSLNQCNDLQQTDNHIKLLLSIDNKNILLCGTLFQGLCQIIDENLNLIINSSIPIVANDPINSTIGLILPDKNLIYIGVTYTNEGIHRWQIPNLAGRSLNISNFMKILSTNDEDSISRDDLSLRFMPRQQITFIVQYIYSFYTKNYIYFLTNQQNDLEQSNIQTKVIRFCRNTSKSIIHSYTEIPLICFNSEWILKSAEIINQKILIGLFIKRDGSIGTNMCSWDIENHIDKGFQENYFNCYSMGIGQRGLSFIKPNEPCRRDESWSIGMNKDGLCSSIISDRLPYPVGGTIPIIGRLFYENSTESSSAFQVHTFGSSILLLQGLMNGTFKLGILDFITNIKWIYSYQLSSIVSQILFDNQTASFFLASGSKITRLSFSGDCASRFSCDECLSSSNNLFCGWCTTNERCTLSNDCSGNSWQQESNQCIHIINVQPLNASLDQTQWINLTLSKLPQLEYNEIYQCIFADKIMSASTQAIKLDYNRLSCPTPSNIHIQMAGNELKVRLSIIKWPSNSSIATIPEFTFFNCSSYISCETCRFQKGCQWCSDRCSSMCIESSQCSSFTLLDPSNIFIESGQSIDIPLKLNNTIKSSLECRLNETIIGLIDENNICHISTPPELIKENNQLINLFVYKNNISIGSPVKVFLYKCDLYNSCNKCQSNLKCSWCQEKCLTKISNKCLTNTQCSSLYIKDFFPKILPLGGETIVTIYLSELITNSIDRITIIDIPCSTIKSSDKIECQSSKSNSSQQGSIKIYLSNSLIIISQEYIQYIQSSIINVNPLIIYEFGGQILHITGKNLVIGNTQQIFLGNSSCLILKSEIITNILSCRLPSILSGLYNLTIIIDKNTILINANVLKVTPNPIVQHINPTNSFASGGRLITIEGMYFQSAQVILLEFSYQKWNAKLEINSNDIIVSDNGILSSFTFRTPSIPSPSKEFNSPPIDVDFSMNFDNLIFLSNLIQFHYIPDVLLNISSSPPTLLYTGEELKLQVENLTEAASIDDIQLFIGCEQCKLKTFTAKGITCQPPNHLLTNRPLLLNNQQLQVDCTIYNSSIGPIRFRIGFREYLIGYLSYIRPSSSQYSVATIIYLSLASCFLTIALLTCGLCLYIKLKKSKEKSRALSPIRNLEQNEKTFWSTTTTSAAAAAASGPYYQVYEQISSSSSHQNTLTRDPLLVCPYHHHYKQEYSTLSLIQQSQNNLPFLTTISVEHDQLKQLIFTSDIKYFSSNLRQSMELFHDLLNMKPFSEAFIDQLIITKSNDLYKFYAYIFRYTPSNLKSFPSTREFCYLKLISKLLSQSKSDLIEIFSLFDKLINCLINLLDNSPCDQLLNRSMTSISSSTLLLLNLEYNYLNLSINYENLLHFHLSVLDCDTLDQVKQKLIHYFNSYEKTSRLIDFEQLDLFLPLSNLCSCTHQIPIMKQYLINSTIYSRKNCEEKKETKNFYFYHLCTDNQLINEEYLIREKLKENKKYLENFLKKFFQEIIKKLNKFSIWDQQFNEYIQLISDLIRRLNILIISRSTCPIIQSCLNVIADGLEFIFQTKTEFSSEIELLFADERKHFSSFDRNTFNISPSSVINSFPLSMDIRSLILADDTAIECLFKLYQFYELYSESINQHIGENHVSVLLPVHHLLVQIRQLINSDTNRTNTTII